MTSKAIIFDMDGLVFDSEKVYEAGWHAGLKVKGITSISEQEVADFRGSSAEDNTKYLVDKLNDLELVLEIRDIREKYFFDQVDKGAVDFMPYAREMILNLKEKGYRLALASSSDLARVSPLLKVNNLEDVFEVVIAGDMVEKRKPHPDIYQMALDKLGLDANQTVAFEDTLTGVSAAKAAGIQVYYVNSEEEGVDYTTLKKAYDDLF